MYLSSHFKREKRMIAETIVAAIKSLDPPGRFLSRDSRTGLWFSIGEDRAREKASQALRENSKKIRAEIQQSDQLRKRESAAEHTPSSHPPHASHHRMDYNPKSGAGHYEPPPFPYRHPPPSGPGWGYPYYYGYGAHQVPPYPPPPPPGVFHPHGFPPLGPPPPHMHPLGPASGGPPGPGGPPPPMYGAYPDVVQPYGAGPGPDFDHIGERERDASGRSSSFKAALTAVQAEDRLQHADNDHHMDGASSDGAQRDEPQSSEEEPFHPSSRHHSSHHHLHHHPSHHHHAHHPHHPHHRSGEEYADDERPSLPTKCRRLEPPREATGSGSNTTSPDEKDLCLSQPTSFYLPKEAQNRHGFGHPPPVMPTLNSCNGTSNDGSHKCDEPLESPQKLNLSRPSFPLKSLHQDRSSPPSHHPQQHADGPRDGRDRDLHRHHNASTPVQKLIQASPPNTGGSGSYSIRSPHNFGPSRHHQHSQHHHPGAELTPAGATCMAALDEILASPTSNHHHHHPHENAIVYGHPHPHSHQPSPAGIGCNAIDSPLGASPGSSSKGSAVPFSPIRAHLDSKACGTLKPRPYNYC